MSFFELRKFCDSCPTLTEGEVESGIVDLVERGDKDKAEYFGAQARMLGWKDELKSPPQNDGI